MIRVQKILEKQATKTTMLLQVHDELVFEVAPDEQEQLIPLIETEMKNAIPMKTPILIESGMGANWLEAH